MKNLKFFLLALTLCTFQSSCGNNNYQPKLIEIYYNDGFNTRHVFIADSLDSMNDVIKSDSYLNKVAGVDYPDRYLISQQSIIYLSKYINANCNVKKHEDANRQESFGVISYTDNKKQRCYYFDDKEVVKYFEGMLSWIDKSDNRREFSELVSQLNLFISNRTFRK